MNANDIQFDSSLSLLENFKRNGVDPQKFVDTLEEQKANVITKHLGGGKKGASKGGDGNEDEEKQMFYAGWAVIIGSVLVAYELSTAKINPVAVALASCPSSPPPINLPDFLPEAVTTAINAFFSTKTKEAHDVAVSIANMWAGSENGARGLIALNLISELSILMKLTNAEILAATSLLQARTADVVGGCGAMIGVAMIANRNGVKASVSNDANIPALIDPAVTTNARDLAYRARQLYDLTYAYQENPGSSQYNENSYYASKVGGGKPENSKKFKDILLAIGVSDDAAEKVRKNIEDIKRGGFKKNTTRRRKH